MARRQILIWAEHAFQLYSVKPLCERYARRGHDVHVMTEHVPREVCARYLGIPESRVLLIKEHKRRWHSRLLKLFEALFVDLSYSTVYADNNKREAGIHKLLRSIRCIKFPKEAVNRRFRVMLWLLKIFPAARLGGLKPDLLISFTKVFNVFLIPQGVRHVSIMESWDHPIKLPYFTQPDYCLTWNSDLADDTRRTQFLHRIAKIVPLKFRYIRERQGKSDDELLASLENVAHRDEIMRLKGLREKGKVVLYPTTTSSAGIEHEGEMRLIADICKGLEGTGHVLYIKPKPNGPQGDYDRFAHLPHVVVGAYSSNPDSRDMLDEGYHTFRYLILRNADVVVNAGTTFVLEAALMGRPVVQLNLSEGAYGGFARFTKTYHLEKYILGLPGCTPYGGDPFAIRRALDNVDMNLSAAMRQWITKWT